MKHWQLEDIAWDRFDATEVSAEIVPLIKSAALVERNGRTYAAYLWRVFAGDAAFGAEIGRWADEEVQHGEALARWAQLADPAWNFEAARDIFNAGYQPPLDAETSVRGSRTGELVARCMVETGTSSYYTALADACREPVLKQLCRHIAADEFRHYKLFYEHMRRYQAQEHVGHIRRLFTVLCRAGEGEDDELAYAYHCANEPHAAQYDRARCSGAYLAGTMRFYGIGHVQRATRMMLKAAGLPTQGRLSSLAAQGAWWWLNRPRAGIKSPATASV